MDGSGITAAVRAFQASDERCWDEFVQASAEGTFFHLSAWKRVIERAFGHRTYYLLCERAGVVTGVLPLTHVKSLLFGSSLISNAFGVHGGPIAADTESLRLLEGEAIRLMDVLGIPVLELRGFSHTRGDWPSRADLYVNFTRPIDPAVDKNLKLIPRKQRAMIRKAQGMGLASEVDAKVDRLYPVYAESVRNLGTPVFGKSYFRILREEFADCSDIVTVTSNGKAVASVLNFYFRDQVLPYYGGGTAAARALAANDFMYWEVMRRACERGYRVFDFGRSKLGTGSYAFKRNWGFAAVPMHYQYQLTSGHGIPDLNPLNPKLKLFVSTWKHMPLPLARLFGPAIVRGIG